MLICKQYLLLFISFNLGNYILELISKGKEILKGNSSKCKNILLFAWISGTLSLALSTGSWTSCSDIFSDHISCLLSNNSLYLSIRIQGEGKLGDKIKKAFC